MELRREGRKVDGLPQGDTTTATVTEPKFSKFVTKHHDSHSYGT
jgi:hypothetical protein